MKNLVCNELFNVISKRGGSTLFHKHIPMSKWLIWYTGVGRAYAWGAPGIVPLREGLAEARVVLTEVDESITK